jgi:hypothetical protein
MSIASFFNSPRPNYEITNLSAAPSVPIDAIVPKITSIVKKADGSARTISSLLGFIT